MKNKHTFNPSIVSKIRFFSGYHLINTRAISLLIKKMVLTSLNKIDAINGFATSKLLL
jgi:hypothetical protein